MAKDLGHLGDMPTTIKKETRTLEEQLAQCRTERGRRMVRGWIKRRDLRAAEGGSSS